METTTSESQSRNAAKVAGFAAAIVLTGTVVTKGVRWGKAKLASRKSHAPAHVAK